MDKNRRSLTIQSGRIFKGGQYILCAFMLWFTQFTSDLVPVYIVY